MIKRPAPSFTGTILIIYYVVGIAGLSIPSTRALFTMLTPISLLMSLALLMVYHNGWKTKYVFAFALIAILGYLVEVAGVLTGEVFGAYTYGKTLGLKILDTPLMIGVNWLMLIYCVYAILENAVWPWWLKILAAASMMVVYDIIMEPVAISLDMWNWGGGRIPLQNYVAWFGVSVVLLGLMHLTGVKTGNRIAAWLFGVQAGFFLILNIVL
jgi:bisanhydrobacterioruberin hydratase